MRFGYHGIGRDARRTFRVDRMEGVEVNAHSVWAERNGLGTLESTDDDGGRVRRFRVVQADPFLRWILGNVLQHGLDAEVLEPEGVRERVQRLVL